MTRQLKPVDDTPICDPAYLRRIDPVWMPGPVPPRFWQDRENRRNYLLWLAKKLGLRSMADCYRLEFSKVLAKHYGLGLRTYWSDSALSALRDCFPAYDWKPWLFSHVPAGFWDSRSNRRKYMAWLGSRLGYRSRDDWYAVTIYDFMRNRGMGVLSCHSDSPVRAVMDLIPATNWCEWKFRQVPMGFWDVPQNRHRYLRWLGKELGYRRAEDWLRVRCIDFIRHRGEKLLMRGTSLCDLMREFLPQLDWERVDIHRPIKPADVLAWADAYHSRHGKWPTATSGDIPESGHSWAAINYCLRSGSRGLPSRTSLARFLEKHRDVPINRGSVGVAPKLSEEQILAWADDYFTAQGKWPSNQSGPIAGTTETWCRISDALCLGNRGLPGGGSLAKLLAQHRGTRNHMRLPPLKKREILAWAKGFFAANGRWPSHNSGPIAQSPGENWRNVDWALRMGRRGLSGGSSLSKLLRKHGFT